MNVIANKRLKAFGAEFPEAASQLQVWRKLLVKSSPKNFADLRAIFGSVDIVGDKYVFDIKGNDYRLICSIDFNTQRCFIKRVMTHTEYDRGKWK